MRKLIIHRKKKFVAMAVPFWIVTGVSKADFMRKFGIEDDITCKLDRYGHPVKRFEFEPDAYGVPIMNGKTLELEIGEQVKTVFAVTAEGLLSKEVVLNDKMTVFEMELSVKGGWRTPSYPYFVAE